MAAAERVQVVTGGNRRSLELVGATPAEVRQAVGANPRALVLISDRPVDESVTVAPGDKVEVVQPVPRFG